MSSIREKCGTISTPLTLSMTHLAATSALGFPTSSSLITKTHKPNQSIVYETINPYVRGRMRNHLKKNWRLRLVTSIRSMSITSRLQNPERAKSLRSSQPNPLAPTTKTLTYSRISSLSCIIEIQLSRTRRRWNASTKKGVNNKIN